MGAIKIRASIQFPRSVHKNDNNIFKIPQTIMDKQLEVIIGHPNLDEQRLMLYGYGDFGDIVMYNVGHNNRQTRKRPYHHHVFCRKYSHSVCRELLDLYSDFIPNSLQLQVRHCQEHNFHFVKKRSCTQKKRV